MKLGHAEMTPNIYESCFINGPRVIFNCCQDGTDADKESNWGGFCGEADERYLFGIEFWI